MPGALEPQGDGFCTSQNLCSFLFTRQAFWFKTRRFGGPPHLLISICEGVALMFPTSSQVQGHRGSLQPPVEAVCTAGMGPWAAVDPGPGASPQAGEARLRDSSLASLLGQHVLSEAASLRQGQHQRVSTAGRPGFISKLLQ